MSSYTNAPACQMLATHCCACGRPLVDAISVSMGIGPECRGGNNGGISVEQQDAANKITYLAAIAAQEGKVEEVRQHANSLRELGLPVLAEKVAERFVNAERNAKIKITEHQGMLKVVTPFRRGDKQAFIEAWRAIPGRRYSNGANLNRRQKPLRVFHKTHRPKKPVGLFFGQKIMDIFVEYSISP